MGIRQYQTLVRKRLTTIYKKHKPLMKLLLSLPLILTIYYHTSTTLLDLIILTLTLPLLLIFILTLYKKVMPNE